MNVAANSELEAAFKRHQTGEFASAISGYRRVLALEPSDVNGWHLIGCVLSQANGGESAIRFLRRAVGIDRSNATVLSNLGHALLKAGVATDAESTFLAALEVDGGFRSALVGLANLLGGTGRIAAAEALLRRLIALEPGLSGALVYRAELALSKWALREVATSVRRAQAVETAGLVGASLVVLPFAALTADQIANLDRATVVRNLVDAGLRGQADDPFRPWSVMSVVSMFQFAGWPDDERTEADRQTLFRRAAAAFAGRCGGRVGPLRSLGVESAPRLALVVSKLTDMRHAPTRFILNWAKWAAEDIPELSVLVAVVHDPDSEKHRALHEGFIGEGRVSFRYADMKSPPVERDCSSLARIDEFRPSAVLCWADELPLEEEIYRRYPVIQFSQMLRYPLPSADVIATLFDGDKARARWRLQKLDGVERAVVHRLAAVPVDSPAPARRRTRRELGLDAQAFVIVSVSNRLQLEVTPAFLDMMFAHLDANRASVWLCVGAPAFGRLQYDNHPLVHRCRFIAYDQDLPGLFALCDAYANLPQRGGGLSLLWAMAAGMPALTLNAAADGAGYVPDEDLVPDLGAYRSALDRLATEPVLRAEFGKRMAIAATRLTSRRLVVEDLRSMMDLAIDSFRRRQGATTG